MSIEEIGLFDKAKQEWKIGEPGFSTNGHSDKLARLESVQFDWRWNDAESERIQKLSIYNVSSFNMYLHSILEAQLNFFSFQWLAG